MTSDSLHLGIDLGSVSLKVVLIDRNDHILFERWTRVSGAPLEVVSSIMEELRLKYPGTAVASMGVTGSGRSLIASAVGATQVNEISAHSAAASKLHGEIKTIIEIGGQDSKLVILKDDGAIRDFKMNELCAAGTGAFLDQQATRLGMSIESFAALADDATDPVAIAGRCAVFAKTDMTHHQQEGRPLSDIVAGLNEALVRSYLSNLVRGKDLPTPIAFQGGVASNAGLVRAFRKILELEENDLIVPQNHLTMGAIGAAIISTTDADFEPKSFDRIIHEISNCIIAGSEADENHGVRLEKSSGAPLSPEFEELNLDGTFLGIDVGSVSVKLVLMGKGGLAFEDYRFSDGKPLDLLKVMIRNMNSQIGDLPIDGVGITGSGRNFIGKLLGVDVILNEITAQIRAAGFIMPKADTIIEIGGQDAKFMRIENGHASRFEMNKVCAAGTGAFLQEQAERLKVDLKRDFAALAFESMKPASLGARCTVFMESDLVSHQQMGYKKRDLVAGLSHSVVTNYLEKVVSGSPIGEKILFLGGVAENRAIVAALESQLERDIRTSTIGKLSGAIGAALAAFDARVSGRYAVSTFRSSLDSLEFEQFHCEDCPNACLITRAYDSRFTGHDSRPLTLGGRCGKWDASSVRTGPTRKSLISKRIELLEGRRSKIEDQKKSIIRPTNFDPRSSICEYKIGIPRALMAYDRLPLWRTFFEELGCAVVLSPHTDKALLEEGMKHLAVETCLPIKAFCSHIHHLQTGYDIDYIFVPSLVYSPSDKHNRDTSQCPYVQAARQFANNVATMPILNPVISWKWHPEAEKREMIKLARDLGFAKDKSALAWEKACDHQQKFRDELLSMGARTIRDLENGTLPRAFLLLGKDYNISDPKLNSDVVGIFESFGETLITQDMLADDSGNYSPDFKTLLWTHGKEILSAAEITTRVKNLYPVMITNFGCGPDSFTTRFAQKAAGDKPFLTLEVDEHSSAVGMETRIEAFLDSLPEHETETTAKYHDIPKVKRGTKRIYLPNFSDHGYAFAATFRSLGFEPVLTPLPDHESLRIGSKHSTSGECHPYTLMLGDYIKAARSADDFSDALFFMPDSGLCRVCQFGSMMRMVAKKENLNLPIHTNIEEILRSNTGATRQSRLQAVMIYWQMMRGMDFLSQKFFETRAYEIDAGNADAAHAEVRASLMKFINNDKPLEGLRNAIKIFDGVRVDKSTKRLKIGITGDYYTRICDYANSDIFRDIERLGGVVMLPPTMCEFAKYDNYQKTTWAINHRQPMKFFRHMVARGIVKRKEDEIRKLFGDGIEYGIPLEYKGAIERLKPYMDEKLPSGLTSSASAILEQISAGADGLLNLITFHCTYGLILSSVLAEIDKHHPDLPKLTLIFEGIKPNHNKLRLEAFMDRVRSCSKENI